jgi:hypothetical protein
MRADIRNCCGRKRGTEGWVDGLVNSGNSASRSHSRTHAGTCLCHRRSSGGYWYWRRRRCLRRSIGCHCTAVTIGLDVKLMSVLTAHGLIDACCRRLQLSRQISRRCALEVRITLHVRSCLCCFLRRE